MITSVRDILFPRGGAGKAEFDKKIRMRLLPAVAASSRDITEAVLDVLDIPLSDVLVNAWETYSEVRSAKAETRAKHEARKQIRIAGHKLTSVHHPKVQCALDGKTILELNLDLDLSLRIHGAVVTVVGGDVLSIDPGSATATASVGLGGETLWTAPAVQVDLPKWSRPAPDAADTRADLLVGDSATLAFDAASLARTVPRPHRPSPASAAR